MKLTYNTRKLAQSFSSDKELSKNYGVLARKVKQRIQQLESADNLWIIAQLPALRLHAYHGDRKGIWSIDIQQNWRILFRPDHDPIPALQQGGIDLKAITITY
jgi:toxin HigB-1